MLNLHNLTKQNCLHVASVLHHLLRGIWEGRQIQSCAVVLSFDDGLHNAQNPIKCRSPIAGIGRKKFEHFQEAVQQFHIFHTHKERHILCK